MGYLDTICSVLWVFTFIISAPNILWSLHAIPGMHTYLWRVTNWIISHFLILVTAVTILSWWVAAVCLGLTDTVTKVKTNLSQKSQRYTSRRNGVPHPCYETHYKWYPVARSLLCVLCSWYTKRRLRWFVFITCWIMGQIKACLNKNRSLSSGCYFCA